MSTIQNPIKRIYLTGEYPKLCIEVELPKEMNIDYRKTKIMKLVTPVIDENVDELFDMVLKLFGIKLQKSDLSPVTFVNMFCSDNDAKLSDVPQPVLQSTTNQDLIL